MSRIVKRMVFWAIAIPVAVAVLGKVADGLEERRGPNSKAAMGVRTVSKVVRAAR